MKWRNDKSLLNYKLIAYVSAIVVPASMGD